MTAAGRLPRLVSGGALALLAAAAWWLLTAEWQTMLDMGRAAPLRAPVGTLVLQDLRWQVAVAMMQPASALIYLSISALMWVVMMVAMMTPVVLPVVLLFQRTREATPGRTPAFVAGYLGAWSLFGCALSAVQWLLHRASLLHGMLLQAGPTLAAGLLIVAGLYQFTPVKRACLRHCQSPLAFLLNHWRTGRWGAFRMGATHGSYCLGCCWALMLLMFVGGVMSVVAMALLAATMLLERVLPAGPWSYALPGAVLLAAGVALALG